MNVVMARSGLLRPLTIAVCGIAALTASSWLAVPMFPVPVTMQTAVVLLLGALCGAGLGSGIVLGWLGLAFVGAPVLADGMGGPGSFVGPTAGYLAAFPVAAFLAGFVTRKKSWTGTGVRFGAFIALHAVILGGGFLWLSTLIGAEAAFAGGVLPFVIGVFLKSGLAAALVAALPNFRSAR